MPRVTANQQRQLDCLLRTMRRRGVDDPRILAAFGRTPRHWFLDQFDSPDQRQPDGRPVTHAVGPESDSPELLAKVYADSALTIQRLDGHATSSTSQPSLMAQMLAAIDPLPGARVLEIGTGTGWNAALLSRLVGPEGEVVSVEFDQSLADAARSRLAALGLSANITVMAGEGTLGAATFAPFDAILVTVAAPDVATAWLDQLGEGGRLCLPLALPDGSSPLLHVERAGQRFPARFGQLTWFVSLRGAGLEPWPEPLDPDTDEALAALLASPPSCAAVPWSGRRTDRLVTDFGHFLLASTGAELALLTETAAGRRHRHPVFYTTGSLAVVEPKQLRGHGSPAMLERLERRAAGWWSAGAPALSDFAAEVHRGALASTGLAIRRTNVTIALRPEPQPSS